MNQDRHERIGDLFDAALNLPPLQRDDYLFEVCGEDSDLLDAVKRLLANHSDSDTFLEPILERQMPSVIGPYRIVKQLGEGGMGTVYLAQQTHPIRREVALKVIKPGMDSKSVIARFDSERRALALMAHPNIAQVFDAGTTDLGLPYFVMELADGLPITQYCQAARLDIRERIELFLPVCQAIQHAHQKGIIHRDIKPSNIIVTVAEGKPVPKVIDFGLAKALQSDLGGATMVTGLGTVVGTLQYMSPEQAEIGTRDVDTRSDVYSLGALLYELLTGSPPLDAALIAKENYLAILARIRDEEPQAPSVRLKASAEFTKPLDSELDWIPLKALEKERSRRYETVNGLMQDLRRYLAGEPVEAAPPSRTYRIGKFARRHRPWILTAAAFALVLIAALVWSAWMAVRATRAEQESRAINEFLQRDVLGQASPYQQGGKPDPNLTVRAAVERAAASIDGRFRDQPAVEASLRNRIGSILTGLGAFQAGQPQLRRALQMRQSLLGDTDETTIESKEALASNLLGSGDGAGAEALLTEALATARASLAPGNRVRSQVEESLAWVKYNLGKYDEGIALVERVEKEAIGTSDAAHPAPGDVQYILFALHYDKGNYVEAKAALTKTFESSKKQYGEASSQTVALYGGFAMICMAQGLWQEAEEYYVKDLAQARRTFGPAHPNTLVAMYNLAQNHVQRGNYPQAEALFRENYQHRVTIYKPDHPRTMMFMNEWANFHTVQNKLVEADAIFAGYIPLLRKTLEAEHPTAIAANAGLAELRRRQKRYPEAEALLVKNVEWKQRKFGIGGDNTLLGMAALARVLVQHGHFADAETLARSASEGLAKADVWERFHARSLLGASFVGQRKFIEAEPNLIAGYEGMVQRKRFIPAGDLDALSEAGDRVVDFYRRQGKADQAMEWKRKIRH